MATERPDDTIFAGGAGEGEVLEFPDISRGWGVTIDGKNAKGDKITDPTNGIPPMEWFNSLFQRIDKRMLWLLQNALPEWAAGSWPKGATVISVDTVYRAQKDTTAKPGDGGDWLALFPVSNLDGRYLQQGKNLADLTDKNKAISNLGLDSRYLPAFPVNTQGGGAHYTKIATIGISTTNAANTTLLASGDNNFGENVNQTSIVSLSFRGNTPNIRHLILSDAGGADNRATWGYVISSDKKSADFYSIRPTFSGALTIGVLSKASGITLHNDAPTTTSKPDGLVVANPLFAWSDAHKASASDVDAVSASKGGTFKGDVTFEKTAIAKLVKSTTVLMAVGQRDYLPGSQGAYIGWNRNSGSGRMDFINHHGNGGGGFDFWNGNESSQKNIASIDANGGLTLSGGVNSGGTISLTNELNTLRQYTGTINNGDYLNGGLLRSFLQGRGANSDARGAYASLYIQEHVGTDHKAVLNVNGFGKDLNWTFSADGSFYSPGIITEAGQRVYSPNNPPPDTTSASPNGWWKDSRTGIIIQFGYATKSGDTYVSSVTFPAGFPTACRSITANPAISTASDNSTRNIQIHDVGNGGFQYTAGTAETAIFWMAIGY